MSLEQKTFRLALVRVNIGCSPYDISIDQNTCTPSSPTVSTGSCSHLGPSTLATPSSCTSPCSPPPSSASGMDAKPVMASRLIYTVQGMRIFAKMSRGAARERAEDSKRWWC